MPVPRNWSYLGIRTNLLLLLYHGHQKEHLNFAHLKIESKVLHSTAMVFAVTEFQGSHEDCLSLFWKNNLCGRKLFWAVSGKRVGVRDSERSVDRSLYTLLLVFHSCLLCMLYFEEGNCLRVIVCSFWYISLLCHVSKESLRNSPHSSFLIPIYDIPCFQNSAMLAIDYSCVFLFQQFICVQFATDV